MKKKGERKVVRLVCPICKDYYYKDPYEVKRNERLGRVSLCSRTCHATFMNLSPAKQAQTREMLAERNANQFRADNANWKGGISNKLKPLPE